MAASWTHLLKDKVVLVTGAGGALGRGISQVAAEHGALVAVSDVKKETADETVAIIKAAGGRAHAFDVDVASDKSVQAWIAQVVLHFGRIDVLVNNAAVFIFGTVEEATDSDWDRVLSVNVKGYALCAKHAVPHIKAQGGGAIVNIASISSLVSQPAFVPYSTSKGAILQMTRNLAHDLGTHGIRVNAVCPGHIDTPATSLHATKVGKTKAELVSEIISGQFVNYLGDPRDIGNAVVFLASNLSRFTTGTQLVCDGGWVVH